ncbi:hypothetical protein M501DRAFT_172314 [Patellaria atrata CBS 101060]|uniref:Transmembrane protein n=1 Tax=Patellaria atrata CBS 101060 TaxID=1346257 RepID=A0A9P4S9H9_9PEZI|nr:hypothetical protein M501DRAFT_172314 [Patellaria atrata CBS 101060]
MSESEKIKSIPLTPSLTPRTSHRPHTQPNSTTRLHKLPCLNSCNSPVIAYPPPARYRGLDARSDIDSRRSPSGLLRVRCFVSFCFIFTIHSFFRSISSPTFSLKKKREKKRLTGLRFCFYFCFTLLF